MSGNSNNANTYLYKPCKTNILCSSMQRQPPHLLIHLLLLPTGMDGQELFLRIDVWAGAVPGIFLKSPEPTLPPNQAGSFPTWPIVWVSKMSWICHLDLAMLYRKCNLSVRPFSLGRITMQLSAHLHVRLAEDGCKFNHSIHIVRRIEKRKTFGEETEQNHTTRPNIDH